MISAVVLAKNEEENIKECLEGLGWCDEVLVIDDYSKDKTRDIAKKLGVRILVHPLNGDFAQQRNFALKEAKHDWILFVDADERVSPELAAEIQDEIKKTPQTNGFFFKRADFFMGKCLGHGETGGIGKVGELGVIGDIGGFGGQEGFGRLGGIKILRLGKRGSGCWVRKVDEKWQLNGKVKLLKNPLLHYSHLNLTDFLTSINEKSTLNAQRMYEDGKRLNFGDWFKPLAKFIWNYFFLFGFLDGIWGFVFAILMSLHSFMVRGKLYLIWRREGGWK